jgi:hypothetical protein
MWPGDRRRATGTPAGERAKSSAWTKAAPAKSAGPVNPPTLGSWRSTRAARRLPARWRCGVAQVSTAAAAHSNTAVTDPSASGWRPWMRPALISSQAAVAVINAAHSNGRWGR